MKNLKSLFITLIISTSAFSQQVFRSPDIYNNELQDSYYILLKADAKYIQEDWKNYLDAKGKVSVTGENQFSIDRFYDQFISRDMDHMVSFVKEEKTYTKVSVILLTAGGAGVDKAAVNQKEMANFLLDFYDKAVHNEEIRLAEADFKSTEDEFEAAKKNMNKVEKSLEANLKAQEKLGKKLDATPEKLTQIIKEKDNIYQESLQKENTDGMTETEKAEYLKKLESKEKEIVKSQKEKSKNSSKLEKKEAEFEDLTHKLFEAKQRLKVMTEVYESKKLMMRDLK